jgi:hypothetical protein
MPLKDSSEDDDCVTCGHQRNQHISRSNHCDVCHEDWWLKRSDMTCSHAFLPAEPEAAGCKHPNVMQITGDRLWRHGRMGFVCHDCGEAWTNAAEDPNPDPRSGYRDADEAASMESNCHGGFGVCCSAPEKHVQVDPAPRRRPYAVAYAVEGGAQYEIALPGDASVHAVDGALIITHSSAILALTDVRPMEGR